MLISRAWSTSSGRGRLRPKPHLLTEARYSLRIFPYTVQYLTAHYKGTRESDGMRN